MKRDQSIKAQKDKMDKRNITENMMMRKKSQITLFVMLGLVLLIIFIILMFIKENLEPKRYGLEEILDELETGKIKNHITNCITDVSMDGLEMLGANGGFIYDFQGGQIPFRSLNLGGDYLNYTSLNKHYFVAYALKKNEFCNQLSYLTPDYPRSNARFAELNQFYNSNCLYDSPYSAYDGFFGQSVMTKLCYILRESGCEPFAKGMQIGFTIQKQLESYTAAKLPLCVNFSAFTQRMGLMSITPEASPVVEVNIHAADLVLVVTYPVKIIFEDREPITKLLHYQTTLNVRLGGIYNFIHNILSQDSKNIALNINNEYISSLYWKQGFELKKIKNPCESCPLPYKEDDILEVVDKKSLVKGKPLVFRVAIENRRPALDFIEDQVIDAESATEFYVPLTGYDPDDNKVKYYFLSFGIGRNECTGTGSYPTPLTAADASATGPSGSLMLGAKGWCEADLRIKAGLPYSEIWAPITRKDCGTHEVAVLVVDDSGMFDYQIFQVDITYSMSPPKDGCEDDCKASGEVGNCYEWCRIAASQCRSACPVGGDFYSSGECWGCVDLILNSAERYSHRDCSIITEKKTCIDDMPDCFWVRENQGNAFVESCYNDADLSLVNPPAYIIDS